MGKKINYFIFLVLVIFGISLYLCKSAPYPFVWISLIFLFLSGYGAFTFDSHARKFFINGIIISTAFLLCEIYFSGLLKLKDAAVAENKKSESPLDRVETSGDYFLDDWVLGMKPRPGGEMKQKRFHGDATIFDVSYNIGMDGLRLSEAKSDAAQAVLFFGDSFTFGLGVQDQDVYPAKFEALTHSEVRGLNLAFNGYGAQQMLRILEVKQEDRYLKNKIKPIAVYYLARSEHLDWAAGRSPWSQVSPDYELDKFGSVSYGGLFTNLLWVKVKRRFSKSYFLEALFKIREGRVTKKTSIEYDIKRYVAIIDRARNLVEERYGVRFQMILWEDESWPLYKPVIEALRAKDISVTTIDEILPDLRSDSSKYLLQGEGHPTPLAHEKIARYIFRYLVTEGKLYAF